MKKSKPVSRKKPSATSKRAKSKNAPSVRIGVETMKTFFARLRRDARNLDRGETLKPRVRIAFEDPADFLLVITPARIRLLRQIGTRSVAVNAVAKALSRDQSAVRRDIVALEAQRLLKTRKVSNPGHGTRTMVSRAAAAIELATVI